MGALDNAANVFVAPRGKIKPGVMMSVAESQVLYRPAKSSSMNTKWVAQVVYLNGAVRHRIKSLETELSHYRGMLDQMVKAETARLNCRLAILESCNSRLGENYHKMHQMYLDLMVKTQSHEADSYQHMLESEMSTLIETITNEVPLSTGGIDRTLLP
ncbi:MAG: hypothetical protein Q8O24_10675 [Gallionellaceae bacterium]|nr:hypothetical protein [Gallionellaceae bacterium]